MEPGNGSYDKNKVLDVKPLRCLAPLFPSPPTGNQFSSSSSSSPFVSAPPFGPLPTGYSPFFPFYNPSEPPPPQQQQNPPPPPTNSDSGKKLKNQGVEAYSVSGESVELQNSHKGDSFVSPSSGDKLNSGHGVGEGTSNGVATKSRKRIRRSDDIKAAAPPDGDSESVWEIRIKFDALRRRISQLEDAKEAASVNRRPDLRAGTLLMNKGIRTNTRKRTGAVPGVEVGDIFFFRFEMCLVGLHAPSMAGIDYMNVKFDQEEETVAVSIVSSGGYEDDVDDKDVLIYSGQGGVSNGKEVADQKLERGNLALSRSLGRGNEVRVIRGMKDLLNPTGKVYVYDGLYRIHESWSEKGKSGCNVFKYKLLRIPGQPEAFGTWKSVRQWRDNIATRPGLILPDLTSGAEKLPVSLVNDIDNEKGPAHFTYSPTLKYLTPNSSMKPGVGCTCQGPCVPRNPNCSCIVNNGGLLPHTINGVLVTRKHLIHECGPLCTCHPNCRNQVSQSGLKVRLEVFKTPDRGWGLRSWDAIRAGMFICEYAGEVIDRTKAENDKDGDEDDYVFDSTCEINNAFEWNYIPELLDEERHSDPAEAGKPPISLVISAKNTGNVARFINHSCSPNVFWQPVVYDNDEAFPHIMFYAMKHIPPMTELTYDYGVGGSYFRNVHKKIKCLCGSSKCRGYIH